MKLDSCDAEPGLWINPAWQPVESGVFAVIIGVSRYDHLDEGLAPNKQTYGLGQLRVSALTAYEMFRWLTEKFRVEGCPLARCWLLLAPTDDELAHAPAMRDNLISPTFANCSKALRFWHHHMRHLPADIAADSRALFFFSGHGLEVHQEQQILLPCDYLAPPSPSLDDAISTDNLKKGLASLAVAHQLFFLDACRNDHQTLRAKNLKGARILTEDESVLTNAERVAPLLYATASGQQAYQQPEPSKGLSLFGRALLDGLAGTPDIDLDCTGPLCAVKLYPLHSYLKRRVIHLIEEARAEVRQPVKLSGIVDNEPITYLDRQAAKWVIGGTMSGALPGYVGSVIGGAAGIVFAPRPTLPLGRGSDTRGVHESSPAAERSRVLHERQFTVTRSLDPRMCDGLWAHDSGVAHDLFGSEDVTAFWTDRLRLFRLGQRDWLGADALRLLSVEHDGDLRTFRAQIELTSDASDPIGHWLQTVDGASTTHACVLPADPSAQPVFSIEFDVSSDVGGGRIMTRLEAYLSPQSPDALGAAAELWNRYRTSDVGEAVSVFKLTALEQMIREKLDSPLVATVAGLILLRANRLDLLGDWLRNLTNWFPEQPDGPVMWAEQLVRRPNNREQVMTEAADYLTDILARGLPHTSEALGYAARLADIFTRLDQKLTPRLRERVRMVLTRIQSALPFFRSGGLFASYSGFDADADPSQLIGPFAMDD